MIQELTIIHLQAIASFLMGIDYFFHEKIKELIEAHLKEWVIDKKSEIDEKIKYQNTIFIASRPLLVTGIFSVALWFGCLISMKIMPNDGNLYILTIIGMLSALGAIKFIEGFMKGVAPYIIPIFVRVVTSFLLYCPKGIIGGIGILFLATSFVFRYINATL